MIDIVIGIVAEYWVLSTYLSVVFLNEGAILVSFSLLGDSPVWKYAFIGGIAAAGVFTNDLMLYIVARYGLSRFFPRKSEYQLIDAETVFQRIFLWNTFVSLLFIKFLFGFRSGLTLYLVAKKRVPFFEFVLFDFFGIVLYVSVLGWIGWLISKGSKEIEASYHSMILNIMIALSLVFLAHTAVFAYRKMKRQRVSA